MNSIRRRRRRPRKLSVNFRTLWWIVQREAALATIAGHLNPEGHAVNALRGKLSMMTTTAVRQMVARRRRGLTVDVGLTVPR
jgi:hypothetical protein